MRRVMWIWKLVAHILPMGVTLAEACLHRWQLFVQMALTELCSPFPCYSESTAHGSHSGSWPSLFLKSPNIYVFFLGERKPGEIAWKTIYQEELNEMTHQSPADGEDSSVVKHRGWGQLCVPDFCQHSWVTAGVRGLARINTHGFAGQKHLLCR